MESAYPGIARHNARVVLHRGEGTLDELIITDENGAEIKDIPLPPRAVGIKAWDRRLLTAGYARITDWTPTASGFRCKILRREDIPE